MLDQGETHVADDYLLLQEHIDSGAATVKKLAMVTGYSAPAIYRYLAGEATIPTVIWRTLYALTQDPRITELITGGVPVAIVPLPPADLDVQACIEGLVNVRQGELQWEQPLLEILSDGRVDHLDAARVSELKRRFPEMIVTLVQLQRAVEREFQAAVK